MYFILPVLLPTLEKGRAIYVHTRKDGYVEGANAKYFCLQCMAHYQQKCEKYAEDRCSNNFNPYNKLRFATIPYTEEEIPIPFRLFLVLS